MNQSFTLKTQDGRSVASRLEINDRAKRVILRLDPKQRQLVVVAPSRRAVDDAMAFAAEKVDWAAKKLASLPSAQGFEPGLSIPLRGHLVQLSDDGPGKCAVLDVSGEAPLLRAPGAAATFADRVTRFLKAEARSDLTEAVDRHARTLSVDPSAISIKDTKTRWGSCSAKGRLNFSWRLICAPPSVLDYVAAHEVSHLIEMNHSHRFWALVDRCVDDANDARRWLKVHGAGLQSLGRSAG